MLHFNDQISLYYIRFYQVTSVIYKNPKPDSFLSFNSYTDMFNIFAVCQSTV